MAHKILIFYKNQKFKICLRKVFFDTTIYNEWKSVFQELKAKTTSILLFKILIMSTIELVIKLIPHFTLIFLLILT